MLRSLWLIITLCVAVLGCSADHPLFVRDVGENSGPGGNPSSIHLPPVLYEGPRLPDVTPVPVIPDTGEINLYTGPSTRFFPLVGVVRAEQTVTATAEYTNADQERWLKVTTSEGASGWAPEVLVHRAAPFAPLPVECPLTAGAANDAAIFRALIEAEGRAVVESSGLSRPERLGLISLIYAREAHIYEATSPRRPMVSPIAWYDAKLTLEINYEVTHGLPAIVRQSPSEACVLTDSRGVYAPRAAPTPVAYTNPLGADEWRFERINGCWAIRQFVFRIQPNQRPLTPCELDWPLRLP